VIPCLKGRVLISLETEKGEVVLNIDGANAPMTAGNFVDLVNRGIYNGTVFHRVVRNPLPFVVQGGDPTTSDSKTPLSAYGTGHFIDPSTGEARFVPLEFRLKSTNSLQYGDEISSPGLIGKLKLTHERGAVAMARSADPNSASAQFYIALEALPELDGHYAVFGRVEQGMDVVDRLQQGDKLIRARIKKP
jgi:peptidyl-prolyl cis-trans isomerase B (cyclophilin B)